MFILGFPVGIVVIVAVLVFKRHRVAFRDPQGNLNRVRKGDPQAEQMLVITGPTAVVGANQPCVRVDRLTGAFKQFLTVDAPVGGLLFGRHSISAKIVAALLVLLGETDIREVLY